jgi:GH15 family glucan-1,4-alpha-glucosidase
VSRSPGPGEDGRREGDAERLGLVSPTRRLIEDYALLSDLQTAALVHRRGSIDWSCFPRFDSDACFAALLGRREHGRWLVALKARGEPTRRYRDGSLVLETEWETDEGRVRVIDLMPPRGEAPDIVRIVEGVSGRPAARASRRCRARRSARASGFTLTWFSSHRDPPAAIDPGEALRETERFWREWTSRCTYEGPYRDDVLRSLVVLKGLTYLPTGGIVAAPTTSLPEWPGSVRNWDYRYCWLRDATVTLLALLKTGYVEEASDWREWLLRAQTQSGRVPAHVGVWPPHAYAAGAALART